MRYMRFLCLLLVSCIVIQGKAQDVRKITDPIARKMQWYDAKNAASIMYIHFDKNVYTSNEQVWFTAYLLKMANALEHHTLSVALVRNNDSAVISDEKFVIQRRFAYGNMVLPDSLLPGDYTFMACTNITDKNGMPDVSFVQPITIKTAATPTYDASLKIAGEITAQSDSVKVAVKAFAKDIFTLIANADLRYTIGRGNTKVSGKMKTNTTGDALITIPLKQLTKGNNVLNVQVNYKKEIKQVKLELPVFNRTATVKYYPEGGQLAGNIVNTVGWEVRNEYDEPLMTSGILYENDQPLDTIQTNGYGMGSFQLVPKKNSKYQVRLLKNGHENIPYVLPAIVADAPVVHIVNALSNDTLVLAIASQNNGRFYCMVHNYTEAFAAFSVNVTSGGTRSMKIPLATVPRGVAVITLLDSLGRPYAERLFFAHYDEKPVVQITTSASEYRIRQKVSLKIKLTDKLHAPLEGVVSIACVQDNRLQPRKMTDIESYFYLGQSLSSIPFRKSPMADSGDGRGYLEAVLLIKGWRRYTWPDMINTKPADTIKSYNSLAFQATVTRNDRQIKKSAPVAILADSALFIMATDANGHLQIPENYMVTKPGGRLTMFVNDRNKEVSHIQVTDPYKAIHAKASVAIAYENLEERTSEKNSDAMVLKVGEKATTLVDVTVVANKDDVIYGYGGGMGGNKCGDYVCMYGILNCRNHPYNGTQPIKGRAYGGVVYAGCILEEKGKEYISFQKGINSAKEFYNIDYSQAGPNEQVFLSTIYWNHSLVISDKNEAEVSFYADDIPGKFRIVVQGITSKGVIHGEQTFEVKK